MKAREGWRNKIKHPSFFFLPSPRAPGQIYTVLSGLPVVMGVESRKAIFLKHKGKNMFEIFAASQLCWSESDEKRGIWVLKRRACDGKWWRRKRGVQTKVDRETCAEWKLMASFTHQQPSFLLEHLSEALSPTDDRGWDVVIKSVGLHLFPIHWHISSVSSPHLS